MSDDYTPITEDVQETYVEGRNAMFDYDDDLKDEGWIGEFVRWLTEHDREVAQNAVNRFYNLLVLKGEYRDIYGLAYIGDLVNKEFRGEVTVVVEGAQIYGEPV